MSSSSSSSTMSSSCNSSSSGGGSSSISSMRSSTTMSSSSYSNLLTQKIYFFSKLFINCARSIVDMRHNAWTCYNSKHFSYAIIMIMPNINFDRPRTSIFASCANVFIKKSKPLTTICNIQARHIATSMHTEPHIVIDKHCFLCPDVAKLWGVLGTWPTSSLTLHISRYSAWRWEGGGAIGGGGSVLPQQWRGGTASTCPAWSIRGGDSGGGGYCRNMPSMEY